jgi:predicted ATPase/DNA-binding SARP family transcriptional activator
MLTVSDLEFRVLGRVEASRGGDPVALGRGASLNLLAGLLTSANNVVTADAAAEFVWGDRQPAHPRAALHTKVSRLRKVLGEEVIETVADGYRLRADPDQLDLLRFDDLIASAADATADTDALAALEEAIGLWRGTPLRNVHSAQLQSEIVPGLVERHLVACERWAEVSLRMGRPGPVAERLAPLVAAHPFRESLAGQLMLARYRAGRAADALAAYDTVRRTLQDELGVDPGKALQDLHTTILRAASGEPPDRPRGDRQRPPWTGRGPSPGGLVGRDADQRVLAGALRSHPAVTVMGPGGVGKTELTLQTASQLAGGFAGGVAVAELGTMPPDHSDDIQAISGVLLGALGAPADPSRPGWQELLDWLRPRALLLVLDNAEHVSPAASRLVDLVARSCPAVRVVTTSRRPLGFAGERVITLARLEPDAAAELLLRRVAERGDDSGLRRDPAGLARLCGLLDGLPLALELAAAKLRTMSLTALTERITARPGLLAVESRPGLAHQRGLHATLRWSYNLLTEPGRLLLTRLAVFAGTFSLADAEQVCGGSPLTQAEVTALLSGLADDSLVHVTGDRDYRLLVPVRDFAASQADPGDLAATRAAHLSYYRAAAELIGGAEAQDRQRVIARLLDSYHEIAAALAWALREEATASEAEDGVRLLLAAQPAWERRPGAILGALAHAVQALRYTAALPVELAAGLLLTAGHLYFRASDLTAAKPLLEQVRSTLDDNDPGHRRDRAAALSFLAAIAYARVEPEAVGLLRETADDARKTGDPQRAGLLLAMVAEMLAQLGHIGEAVALIGEAERGVSSPQRVWLRYLTRRAVVYLRAGRVAEAMADLDVVLAERSQIPTFELASSMVARGYALGRLGRLDAARDTLTEGLRLVHELQAPTLLPDINQALAMVETAAGDLPKAARHVREVLEWALPHSAVIDAVGALHLAVVLAVKLDSPQIGQLAAAVRGCRLATGLPTWPVPAAEYASYEPGPVAVQAAPAGPLRSDTLRQACQLALSALASH